MENRMTGSENILVCKRTREREREKNEMNYNRNERTHQC